MLSENEVKLRDWFAANAMLAVTKETQEMRTKTTWDWIKNMLRVGLNMDFLQVEFVEIDNVYNSASDRAYKYADAMIERRNMDADCFPKKEDARAYKKNDIIGKGLFIGAIICILVAYNLVDIITITH